MRGMFICKTPYQAMVALRISLTKYKSDKIDILLFDTIANVDVLHDRMQEAGVFSNIYVYKCLAYYHLPNMRRRLCPLFLRTKTFNQETYDFVFFSNQYLLKLPDGLAGLARRLNISRATLYRALSDLEQRKLVAHHEKTVHILDHGKLLLFAYNQSHVQGDISIE